MSRVGIFILYRDQTIAPTKVFIKDPSPCSLPEMLTLADGVVASSKNRSALRART